MLKLRELAILLILAGDAASSTVAPICDGVDLFGEAAGRRSAKTGCTAGDDGTDI